MWPETVGSLIESLDQLITVIAAEAAVNCSEQFQQPCQSTAPTSSSTAAVAAAAEDAAAAAARSLMVSGELLTQQSHPTKSKSNVHWGGRGLLLHT